MGNKQTLPANISSLKAGTWVEAGQDQQNALFSNVNPYRRRLLANIMTHELIEQYELNFITEQDYNSYISQLSYRQVNQPPSENGNYQRTKDQQQSFVFPIRYFVNKSRNQMCTTIHTGYLYADKVDLRLKEINDIPFDDLLYVYFATLTGFKLLYEKVGYFDIVEEMVFITRKGEVKVWMNANLAKNYPNYDKNSPNNHTHSQTYSKNQHENIHGSQADMIRRLILLIEKNSDEYEHMDEPQHQLFSQYLQSKNILDKLSFQHSLQELHSYFVQNNLHCPRRMKSIPELFAPDQNHEEPTNYQVSHVNEITTQHLTQLKKGFQPMQTIPEDDKYPSFSNNNKDFHNHNQHQQRSYSKLHESEVNSYKPPSLHQNLQSSHNFDSQFTKVVRPKQHQHTDLGHSRYSQQTQNNKGYDNEHLKKSTRSTTSVQPQIVHKPNSVGSFHYSNQNQIPRGMPVFHHSPYRSQTRIVPANFAVQTPYTHNLNPQQHIVHQQNFPMHHFPTQPIMQPQNHQIQHQILLPQQVHYQNVLPQQIQYQNVTQRQQQFLPPSSFFQTNVENNQMNRVIQPQENYITQNMSSAGLKGQDPQSNSVGRNVQLVQQYSQVKIFQPISGQDGSKSNIKYFTKQESYHIDEEIANDLQKFLGLKVN